LIEDVQQNNMSSLHTIFERKLVATFPDPHQRKAILSQFAHFEHDSSDMRYRLCLAILKLSKGDQNNLDALIKGAIEDPEDAINWAETPFSWEAQLTNQYSENESSTYNLRDWAQYVSWLL